MAVQSQDLTQERILAAAKFFVFHDTYLPYVALGKALDEVLGARADKRTRNLYFGRLIDLTIEMHESAEEARAEERSEIAKKKQAELEQEERAEKENWEVELNRLIEGFPNMNPDDCNEDFYIMVKEAYDKRKLEEGTKTESIERFRVR
jgi:hypothetical protein